MKNKLLGYITGFLSTVIMGAIGIFVRNTNTDVFTITFARYFLGAIFLFVFIKVNRKKILIQRLNIPIIISGASLFFATLCYLNAIRITSITNSVFLLYIAPLLSVLVSRIFFKEKLSVIKVILIFISFVGVVFLLEFKLTYNSKEFVGYILGIGAAISYATFIVFNSRIKANIDSLSRTIYQFIISSIICLPFFLNSISLNITITDIFWLIAIGFFQGFLAITLMIISIKNLDVLEYGVIAYIEPFTAVMIGYFIFLEKLSILKIIGCILIIISGCVLFFFNNYKVAIKNIEI